MPVETPTRTAPLRAMTGGMAAGAVAGLVGAQPARPAAPNRVSNLDVPRVDQGNSNACGTTSMTMILQFWGHNVTRQQVDANIRRSNLADMPTAPDLIVLNARARGMRAELQTGSSLDDLARMVDAHVPVQVLLDPMDENGRFDSSDVNLHYMVVTGVERDAQGRVTHVLGNDPAGGGTFRHTAENFERAWSNLKLKGVPVGINRLIISMVPNNRHYQHIQLPANGLLGDIFSPSRLAREGIAVTALVVNGADAVVTGGAAAGRWVGNQATRFGRWVGLVR